MNWAADGMEGINMSEYNVGKLDIYKEEYESVNMSDEAYRKMVARMNQAKKEKIFMKKMNSYKGFVAAAAAAVVMIIPNVSPVAAYAMENMPVLGGFFKVITIRDYSYDDEFKEAQINVDEIAVEENASVEGEALENAKKSMGEINADMKAMAERYEAEFKASLEEEGYHSVSVSSEVVSTSKDYFTLKLTCFESAADGSEMVYYNTIDLKTGNKVALQNLFKDGSDYKSVIAANIEEQMRANTASDENNIYWLDGEMMTDWSVASSLDNASFYVNQSGSVVISFNEGEVAPMYMGTVEFTIADSVIADLRK